MLFRSLAFEAGDPVRFRCPECGGPAKILAGDELELSSLELDDGDAASA